MTPELYRRASDLFNEVRELPEAQCAAALDRACGENAELRAQVVRMLAADQGATDGSFLNRRAIDDAARLLPGERVSLPAPGTVFGNYRLGARIGAGGMGVVYEAEDLRLNRRVAVKILPPALATDGEERIRRFQREARAASLLSHPHIVTIFDAGFDHGCYYIAMEFVEGKPLRQLIGPGAAAMDGETILDLVGQTASALSAAHQAGIVHRDIKPENIMVRPDGLVKVLDFGLARLEEGAAKSSQASDLPTRPGHLAGTIQYVAPEQVRGQRADPRSDIFSLGVVAYELATGVRPFDGPTDGSVFDAILNRTPPPPSTVRPAAGPLLDGMILQALEKDPDLRFQTASDVRSCCKRLTRDSISPGGSVPIPALSGRAARTWYQSPLAIVIALLMLLAAGASLYIAVRSRQPRPQPQASLLTALPGFQIHPALSADGRELAFSWDGGADNYDIYVKGIHEETPRRLTSNEAQDLNPSWSPDGKQIAFLRFWPQRKQILVIAAEGGPERGITDINPAFAPWSPRPGIKQDTVGPAWSPDGQWLAVSDRCGDKSASDCVFLLSLDGTRRKRITAGSRLGDYGAVFSPDGNRIAFLRPSNTDGVADIYTQALDENATPRRLTSENHVISSLAWGMDGRIFFVSDRKENSKLWSIADSGGDPQPVPDSGPEVFYVTAAAHSTEIAFSRSYRNVNIWRTDLSKPGDPPLLFIGSWRRNHSAQYSPDGSHIVFISDRFGSEEVWIARADGSDLRRVTFSSSPRPIGSPSWSPDGKQLAYDTGVDNHAAIGLMNVDGTNQRLLTTDPWNCMMPAWSRDGHFIYYIVGRNDGLSLWKKPVDGGPSVRLVDDVFSDALDSADGRRVYFLRSSAAKFPSTMGGIWEASSSGGDVRRIPELAGVTESRYCAVTRQGIYFLASELPPWQIRYFDFATRRVSKVIDVPRKPELFTHSLSVSPDGRWMLHTQLDQVGTEISMIGSPQ